MKKLHCIPIAFILSLLVVFFVEWMLRTYCSLKMIPSHPGPSEYGAAIASIEEFGSPTIAILGSSRPRDNIQIDLAKKICLEGSGEQVVVRNFALPGSMPQEVVLVLKRLLRHKGLQVVLYGISPFVVREREAPEHRGWYRVFMDLEDWRVASQMNSLLRLKLLFDASYNELTKNIWLFKYRSIIPSVLYGFRNTGGILYGPSYSGQSPLLHQIWPEKSLLSNPFTADQIRDYIIEKLPSQTYDIGPEHRSYFIELEEICRKNNIKLILFECPYSNRLKKHLPEETLSTFNKFVIPMSKEFNIHYVSVEMLDLSFAEEDFLDLSHLNKRGARRMTEALFRRCVLPILNQEIEKKLDNNP